MNTRIVQPRNAGENHRSQSATSSTDRHRLEQTFASSSERHAYSWRVKRNLKHHAKKMPRAGRTQRYGCTKRKLDNIRRQWFFFSRGMRGKPSRGQFFGMDQGQAIFCHRVFVKQGIDWKDFRRMVSLLRRQ